jgi:peptidoglycan lytic transglycosylase
MTGTAYAAVPAAHTATSSGVTMAGEGSHQKLRYGSPLRLAGFAAHKAPGRPVRLEYAPGGRGWRPVTTTTTQPGGAYGFDVRAGQSGAYRAVAENGGPSTPKQVTVVPRLQGAVTRHVHRRSAVRLHGELRPGLRGRNVRIEMRLRRGWKRVAAARTLAGGRFHAVWHPARTGAFRLRVRFRGDRLNAGASRPLGRRVYVYRPSQASWYGPGFFGGHLACGGRLGAGTLGVANRSLPCGTRVTFRYGRRSVTVPVVDRGPFSGSREWDLTAATKRRLGFPDVGTVWTTR